LIRAGKGVMIPIPLTLAIRACLDYTKRDMKRASKPAPANPARREAVIYARVSSKEQEKEGFSIPAQLKAQGIRGRERFRGGAGIHRH
jgi:hypothetical protein